MKRIPSFIAGLLVGSLLFGGSIAYAAGVTAELSRHVIYLDGTPVELQAYAINGNNYVKLRDVGRLMNFNVYWDGAVQIDSSAPYTGEAPAQPAEAIAPVQPAAVTDWSRDADPAVFDRTYTRDAYNMFRQSIADTERILSGDDYVFRTAQLSDGTRTAMRDVAAAIGNWPVYSVRTDLDGSSCVSVKYTDSYRDAADNCVPFIRQISGLSDEEKAVELAFFLCDHLTYRSDTAATPRTVLASDAVSSGNCMAYAHSYMFLCDLAGIPCILVHSANHQWNQVYVDGNWRNVDVSALDAGDNSAIRSYQTVLYKDAELQNSIYQQTQPALTAFARELLVPGSGNP